MPLILGTRESLVRARPVYNSSEVGACTDPQNQLGTLVMPQLIWLEQGNRSGGVAGKKSASFEEKNQEANLREREMRGQFNIDFTFPWSLLETWVKVRGYTAPCGLDWSGVEEGMCWREMVQGRNTEGRWIERDSAFCFSCCVWAGWLWLSSCCWVN